MKKNYHICAVFTLVLASFLAGVSHVSAATLSLQAPGAVVGTQTPFRLDLKIGTKNPLNAISVGLILPKGIEVQKILNGDSVVNFWVDAPKEDPSTHTLYFSGITPGGFVGSQGEVLGLILKASRAGDYRISFESSTTKAFRNDKPGVAEPLALPSLQITASTNKENTPVSVIDTSMPEAFTPVIGRDADLFEGKWFVSFATQDKESGVDHYEIQETHANNPAADGWTTAQSPYLLQDQSLTSVLFVKAVDGNGNARVASLDEPYAHPWYRNVTLWGIIILILIVIFFSFLQHRRRVRSLYLGIIVAAFLFGGALHVSAATLSVTGVQSAAVGETFTETIKVASTDAPINAVSVTLNFPTDKLQVVSVSKSGSIINLWPQDPAFSNSRGTVTLEGVMLSSTGFQGSAGKVVAVTFKVKSTGSATLSFGNSSVLANDGQGTNVLTSSKSSLITLTPAVATPPPPQPIEAPAPAPVQTPLPTVTVAPTPVPAPVLSISVGYDVLIVAVSIAVFLLLLLVIILWIRVRTLQKELNQCVKTPLPVPQPQSEVHL